MKSGHLFLCIAWCLRHVSAADVARKAVLGDEGGLGGFRVFVSPPVQEASPKKCRVVPGYALATQCRTMLNLLNHAKLPINPQHTLAPNPRRSPEVERLLEELVRPGAVEAKEGPGQGGAALE